MAREVSLSMVDDRWHDRMDGPRAVEDQPEGQTNKVRA
jgi:hypothetical protein|tara:strand:- start:223 stop:336 length:114 start_codon:yes stop_codon:yes gene_type:complete